MNIHSKKPFQDCVGQETTSKGGGQFNFPFINDLEELIACTLKSIDGSLFSEYRHISRKQSVFVFFLCNANRALYAERRMN